MSAPTCKSFLLSSALNINEDAMDVKNQGIVSILRSDTERPTKATSLRRTLSADMSSQKWLTQQGLTSPLKRSPSSVQFPVSSSFEEGKEVENRSQFDILSLIISQKAADEEALKSSPPYVHPLVKRSTCCLSEKSLEICTESLGSETGSDGFSSETGDVEEDKHEDQELQNQNQETVATMMPCFVGKKSPNQSFPPPIPSLSGKDGASRQLKTHRDNGRLVIEAVSMPSPNNFLAQRQDGRLVLTFANTSAINDDDDDDDDDDDEEEEIENKIEGVIENTFCEIEQAPKLSSGAMNVHMNKPIWLVNRNPTRPKSFDQIVSFGEQREGKLEPKSPAPLAQSLPPRPLVARLIPSPPSKVVATTGEGTATSFNAYEYYWRRPNQGVSKVAPEVINPLAQQSPQLKDSKNLMANKDHRQLQVDFIAPLLKGCKEPRRSLLFWEPYCIATS